MDALSPIFTLVTNSKISGEKSVINYLTSHIYDSLFLPLKEEVAMQKDLQALSVAQSTSTLELSMLKDSFEGTSSLTTDLSEKTSHIRNNFTSIRDQIASKVAESEFLGKPCLTVAYKSEVAVKYAGREELKEVKERVGR